MSAPGQAIPVLLLKTKSGPTDAYEELFSAPPRAAGGFAFEPAFVPVLQHQFEEAGLARVRDALRRRRIGRGPDADFGGLVFTSQRAVEAFAKLVAEGRSGGGGGGGEAEDEDEGGNGNADAAAATAFAWPHLQDVPIYSVGPATTRALRAVPQTPPLRIFGEHTGNGDALARFILDHYGAWYGGDDDDAAGPKPPLLFLVGEQRRDIIPRTLMDPALSAARRIPVVEVVVYGTGVMASFPRDFAAQLRRTAQRGGGRPRWVVVFSPTGCDSMLRGLGRLAPHKDDGDADADIDADAAASSSRDQGQEGNNDEGAEVPTYIATIGPTTRDYLQRTFGYEPDVCAETPSPEGVWEAITRFMASSQAS